MQDARHHGSECITPFNPLDNYRFPNKLTGMKIALFADYHGEERMWPLLEDALEDQRFDLIVFTGDILQSAEREEAWQKVLKEGKTTKTKSGDDEDGVIDELTYREFFINLAGFGVPVLFVPGHIDAPTSRIAEAIAGFPNVHNVQLQPFEMSGFAFLGWGGAVGPVDADGEFFCTKERAFKKKVSASFENVSGKSVFLVHTPPVSHPNLDTGIEDLVGSQTVNEVIKKHKPQFCFCGHAHGTPGQDMLGSTVVVNPGPMFKGRYALIDLDSGRVMFPTPLKI